jgi:hypothetical protein
MTASEGGGAVANVASLPLAGAGSVLAMWLCAVAACVSALQDDCRIGAVDPGAYAHIVADVENAPEPDWAAAQRRWEEIQARIERLRKQRGFEGIRELQKLPPREEVLGQALTDRLRPLLNPYTRTDQKIAVMHSYMMKLNAEFDFASVNTDRAPFPEVRGAAFYHYRIDTKNLGYVLPVCQWTMITISYDIAGTTTSPTDSSRSELARTLAWPLGCLESASYRSFRSIPSCPRSPSICSSGCVFDF